MKNIPKESIENYFSERPDWDTWLLALAFLVAQRSLDKHTKCGCVVVDNNHSILSVGYNSPPRGCIDTEIPTERPDKYLFMEHAESNAINNAAKCGTSLNGSRFYVTGPPCNVCLRGILNVGAAEIVCGPIVHRRSPEEIAAVDKMIKGQPLKIRTITELSHISAIVTLFTRTTDYIRYKLQEPR